MRRPYVLPERYTYPLVAGDLGQIDKPKAMLFVTVVKVSRCQRCCMLRACMPFWDAPGQQWPLSGNDGSVLLTEAAARSTSAHCAASGPYLSWTRAGLFALQATNVPKMDFMSDSDPFVL